MKCQPYKGANVDIFKNRFFPNQSHFTHFYSNQASSRIVFCINTSIWYVILFSFVGFSSGDEIFTAFDVSSSASSFCVGTEVSSDQNAYLYLW